MGKILSLRIYIRMAKKELQKDIELPKKKVSPKKIQSPKKEKKIDVEEKIIDDKFDFSKYDLSIFSIKKLRTDWISYRWIAFPWEAHCAICWITCTTCQWKTHCDCWYPTSLIVYANIINRFIKWEAQPYNIQRIIDYKVGKANIVKEDNTKIKFQSSWPMSQCPYCWWIKMYCVHFTNWKY